MRSDAERQLHSMARICENSLHETTEHTHPVTNSQKSVSTANGPVAQALPQYIGNIKVVSMPQSVVGWLVPGFVAWTDHSRWLMEVACIAPASNTHTLTPTHLRGCNRL